jgi:hypothetical protein
MAVSHRPNAAPAGTGSAFPRVEWPKIGPQANFVRLDNVVAAPLTKLQRTLARPA